MLIESDQLMMERWEYSLPGGKASLQFFEIAVGNVVAAPIRNSIKLYAVRELHLILCLEPEALRITVAALSCVLKMFGILLEVWVVGKFDGVGIGMRYGRDPSSVAAGAATRAAGDVAAGWSC